jgi:hypothetical protein
MLQIIKLRNLLPYADIHLYTHWMFAKSSKPTGLEIN